MLKWNGIYGIEFDHTKSGSITSNHRQIGVNIIALLNRF